MRQLQRPGWGAPKAGWPRRSSVALSALGVLILFAIGCLAHATLNPSNVNPASARALVGELGLTDLSLFTAARYTRHPSQADLHSAFQDLPLAFEHFPAGTFMTPPLHLPSGRLTGNNPGGEQ